MIKVCCRVEVVDSLYLVRSTLKLYAIGWNAYMRNKTNMQFSHLLDVFGKKIEKGYPRMDKSCSSYLRLGVENRY